MPGKARIMVVDDELPVCRSVSKALEREDYTVEMALSAEEALKKSKASPYDVIITDLMMPGLSGMDLLKVIQGEAPDTRVIMITGYPSIATAVEALKRGAFDYIPKPFTPDELRSLVSRALASRLYHGEGEIQAPPGTYCIPENSWVRMDEEHNARIGIHHVFLGSIKRITGIELPKPGEMRYQGEACVRVTDTDGHVHKVWTPVSGKVIATNTKVESDFSILSEDPYGAGWLLQITPTNLDAELPGLVKATARATP
jgi:ActR/RegA family two-component response regulator